MLENIPDFLFSLLYPVLKSQHRKSKAMYALHKNQWDIVCFKNSILFFTNI